VELHRPVSAIPKPIIDGLQLASGPQFKVFSRAGVTRIFGYVYNGAERDSPVVTDPRRYLTIDYSRDGDQLVDEGTNSTTYQADCRFALDSALNSNAGYTLAPVTLQAAVQGAISGKLSERISLVGGQFQSPIWNMWGGAAREPERTRGLRFYTAFVFWDWYKRNPTATDNWLLTYANGYSLYRFTEQANSTTVKASARGNLSVPFLTVDASANGNYASEAKLNLQRFEFVLGVYSGGNAFGYDRLPSIDDVLKAIKGNARVAFSTRDDDIVRLGLEKLFYEDVYNVPSGYCDQVYEISGDGANRLRLTNVQLITSDNKEPYCRFVIEYNPVPMAGDATVNLKFSISTKDKPSGKALEIPAEAEFHSSDRPRLELLPGSAERPLVSALADNPNAARLTWTLNFRVFDDNQINGVGQVGIDHVTVDCAAGLPQSFFVDVILPDRGGNVAVRPINMIISAISNGVLAATGWPTAACPITGTIRYTIGAYSVTRVLPDKLQILVPRP
jgi:hypothetical protein